MMMDAALYSPGHQGNHPGHQGNHPEVGQSTLLHSGYTASASPRRTPAPTVVEAAAAAAVAAAAEPLDHHCEVQVKKRKRQVNREARQWQRTDDPDHLTCQVI